MKKLLVIDGNSVLNRAFYGVKPLSTRDGRPTNAIFGFVNIIMKSVEALSPDSVGVAFDLRAPTFRHKKYSLYKANRHGMPEDLALQLEPVKTISELLGFHVLSLEGYEADDILGTSARLADEGGYECYVLTGDRDSLQLISDSTQQPTHERQYGDGEQGKLPTDGNQGAEIADDENRILEQHVE